MAIDATDWTVDRATGNIRYVGHDHGGTAPTYTPVIDFHRWLQGLADDAVASGDDELDITNQNPSARSTDNIITLLSNYNIDDDAAEHIYDGSIIQSSGGTIYDGIVNFGNADVQIQIIQNGAVLSDDWWNYDGAGLNPLSSAGISHRFMLKVRTAGADIDGRRIIGTCRRFGYTYGEFKINGSTRGNNVLALNDAIDLNNASTVGEVSGWSTINNTTEGYAAIDVNNDSTNEYYYSEWNRDTYTINQFYERMKWVSRDGSSETLYGLNGELFRGITHQILYNTLSGTFDDSYSVSWSGGGTGTGQILADDGSGEMWIQLLTGTAPAITCSLSQSSPDAASATAGTVTDRSALISKPFIGVSTGSAIIGAYGVGIEKADLGSADKVFDLTNTQRTPPNNVTNTVAGLAGTPPTQDRVLVAPWDGSTYDDEGNPAIDKDQFSLAATLNATNTASFVVVEAIPTDTPSAGYIRVTDNDGFERRLHYASVATSTKTFTVDTTDGNEDFLSVNADAGNDVYLAYIDELATGGTVTTASYTAVHTAGTRDLVVLCRSGGTAPIKEFISSWSFTSSDQTINAIRTTDE
ncbi:MAG: hypothetical protein ACYTEU_07155 [Planctomycetota bacterium]|jgi:hypothetical protein